jgi:hypothetical protein
MLKKGLLIVAAVAMLAMTVQAGTVKFETWPCQFVAQDLTTIPVKMIIGYYITVVDQSKVITMTQTVAGQTNYSGCVDIKIRCNFTGTLTASVSAVTGPIYDSNNNLIGDKVGGTYSCTLNGVAGGTGIAVVPTGTGSDFTVTVCCYLSGAALNQTAATSKAIQVASVKIKVVPTAAI